ncbi:MAG: hypothetical protein IT427_16125 [Pirellulales bacterium]|nr:hypothetical protein [Pirellulales bacterium]
MKREETDRRARGPHGFALWFVGAPYDARLAATEFWHPALGTDHDGEGKVIVALASNGDIAWSKKDKGPKALSHFTVCALEHLIRTKGDVPFGYLGLGIKTLYNAFIAGGYRSSTIKGIFSNSCNSKYAEAPLGTDMEQAFLVVEGAKKAPVVRLRERFQRPLDAGDTFAIHVFWESSPITRPDWNLGRIYDPKQICELASVLERSLNYAARTGGQAEAVATGTTEGSEQEKENSQQASCAVETGVRTASEDSAGEVNWNDLGVADRMRVTIVRRNFVRLVLKLMIGDTADDFQRHLAREFVSEQVYTSLPDFTSVDAVVAMCDSLGAVDETYRKTLSTLSATFDDIWPEIKNEIHNYLRNSILSCDTAELPPLTIEDRKDVKVRWHEADCQYESEKQKAFTRCEELGFDVKKGAIKLGNVSAILEVLANLLEEMVRIHKAQVFRDGANLSRVNRRRIWERLSEQRRILVEPIREAFEREGILCYSGVTNLRQQMEENYEGLVAIEYSGFFERFTERVKQLEKSLGFEDPLVHYYRDFFKSRREGL